MRHTLGQFRAQWPAEAMGICMIDPMVANYVNDAQQRLLIDPMAPDEGWWGGWVTMALTATLNGCAAYVTTPREIARLIVMAVCDEGIRIRNGFWEYLKFGTGLEPKSCCNATCSEQFQAYERDNVVTFTDLKSTPQTIRVYHSDQKDTGLRVLLQGTDQNRQTIFTTDPNTTLTAPGEYLQLIYPFADSVNTFSTITGIQKDETYGPLQFFQVDPTTGVESALSTMQPEESVASYRRYMITGLANSSICCSGTTTTQIKAQGKLDFIPVVNETDYLTIHNIPALVEECMSIRYGRMDSQNAANQSALHHARALALLNGQLDHYLGKQSIAIRMPIFGSNRLTRQPV